MVDRIAGLDDDRWWCWECHGLGGWEEGEEECSPFDVICPCCDGDGEHDGDNPPKCAPGYQPEAHSA